jgi:hypothetical protein
MTTTVKPWYGPQHALMAAFRACAANMAAVAAGPDWTDPYTTTLPIAPTEFTEAGAPVGGSFYMREQATTESARIMPLVELWVDSSTPTQQTDSEATWFAVRVGVRARVGSESGSTGVATLHARAMSLARLAQVTAAEYCRAAGLIYDADGALGVVYADVDAPPVVDFTAPVQPTAPGSATADAVAFVLVTQRQYAPAGIGSISL